MNNDHDPLGHYPLFTEENVLSFVRTNPHIAGANFWAFGGTAHPIKEQLFWKTGDEYMRDGGARIELLFLIRIEATDSFVIAITYIRLSVYK